MEKNELEFNEDWIKINNNDVPEGEESKMCAILSVALNRANPVSRVVHEINQITGVGSVEEL